MKLMNLKFSTVVAACGLLTTACLAQGPRQVAIGPWDFTDGNVTSRTMVIDTLTSIAGRHNLNVVAQDVVQHANDSMTPGYGWRGNRPSLDGLSRFAGNVHADLVIFGRTSWHTRSIWVGTGPKTISTASIDLFVYNARMNRITYEKRGVEGRSDEKENTLKDIADVILTPLVTVVSGGPATPREQRAAQIAIYRAIRPWMMRREMGR